MIFISRNKLTFLLVVLLLGNIYQYIEKTNIIKDSNQDKKDLNQKILDLNNQSILYERQRSEKLEFLLSNLAKTPSNGQK